MHSRYLLGQRWGVAGLRALIAMLLMAMLFAPSARAQDVGITLETGCIELAADAVVDGTVDLTDLIELPVGGDAVVDVADDVEAALQAAVDAGLSVNLTIDNGVVVGVEVCDGVLVCIEADVLADALVEGGLDIDALLGLDGDVLGTIGVADADVQAALDAAIDAGTAVSLTIEDGIIINVEECDAPGDGGGVVLDEDQDAIPDKQDNCPTVANPDQEDTDGDGIGDACEKDTGAGGETPDNQQGGGKTPDNQQEGEKPDTGAGETPDNQQGSGDKDTDTDTGAGDDKQGELPVTGGAPVSGLFSLFGAAATAMAGLGLFVARRKA